MPAAQDEAVSFRHPERGIEMRRIVHAAAGLCLALATAGSAASDAPNVEPLYRMVAGGSLQIAPDGSVASVEVEPAVELQLREALARTVGKLHFEPIRVKGQAVQATTGFEAVLIGRRSGSGMAVNLDTIDFMTPKGMTPAAVDGDGGIKGKSMRPPVYPHEAQMALRMGQVRLAIRVGADGKAVDVAVVDSLVYDFKFKPGALKSTLSGFEKASMAAARSWTFDVPPDAASRGAEDMTVTTSVVYLFDLKDGMHIDQHGMWWPILKAPRREIAWMPKTSSDRLADTGGTSAIAGGGPVRLRESVAGTTVQ
jgi:hypothetical protein